MPAKSLVVSVAVVVIALVGSGPQAQPPRTAGSIERAEEQARTATEALRLLDQMAEEGAVLGIDARTSIWSRRLVEARRDAGDRRQLVAALTAHVARMKNLSERAERLNEVGRGTALDVLEARYQLVEAERWLAEVQSP